MIPEGQNFKLYGSPPYRVLLVHGGPAAIGYLAPLADYLSGSAGVIDAFQTKSTIRELLGELHDIISNQAEIPVTLIGHSWGAWLSILYASHYRTDVKKLILVGSPPLDENLTGNIMETRLKRLDAKTSSHLSKLMSDIATLPGPEKDQVFLEIASIFRKTDAFELEEDKPPQTYFNLDCYNSIWNEAKQLRFSGDLLHQAEKIGCPTLAIHGTHDPHPAEGVDLSQIIKDFRFILLDKCGHEPWSEKLAKTRFIELLLNEIAD
ncbi:alpha/beta fold hydrolase [Bacteroidota bacterium]